MSSDAAHSNTGGGLGLYFGVWFGLLALTAVEVLLAYMQILSLKGMVMVLMALSVVKSWLIVSFFMHLKSERTSLVLSLIPAVVVVITLLFVFFPDSLRLLELRVP
jgi:cytochrome c oxidase subunit 4